MDRNTRLNELVRILERHGLSCREGKGSELVIEGGTPIPKLHVIGKHGANPQIAKQVIANVRKKFGLTPDEGVTDFKFYGS